MSEPSVFAGLVDLASAALGGRVLGASDDFFAAADNLIDPGPARFDADRYTDRGKWMDGWESRRRRDGGHDWCVVALGAAGRVYGFDIDTRHFVGNHPSYASVDGLRAPRGTPLADLPALGWKALLPELPLRPDSRNLFAAEPLDDVTHVRLSIFPDGGVARWRVFGKVAPGLAEPEVEERSAAEGALGLVDLAGLRAGATAIACSDARFGEMNNLLLPGRAANMGGGWETRRARAPEHSHDWIVVRLALRGTLRLVEVDTNHYKGNFPERFSLEGIDAPGAPTTELIRSRDWKLVVPRLPLRPDHRHFFRGELAPIGPISHARLNIFPDGGVSRLRLWGVADA